ncbi:DUF6777 domain-containing protein [Streptomyces liangshanensis]|uniref:DUF6777 domain-containing protein n=1 Tax=Streptomyces liangshanensis TaxID=2717324 RepID=A0A6G9GT19_9ACTN|nr:DUF6777 domain-containing protein [Streptomyces liangshanensis]QIQ01413.1 hypothetical protein HA039_03075 [Streptomyces liangshanensis]
MRSPNRRRYAPLAALSALAAGALVLSGCGGGGAGKPRAEDLFFQSAGDRGGDPFTPSTVTVTSEGAPAAGRPAARASAGPVRAARALPGSTPGLYGAARSVSSCDVERQIRFLTEDRTRSRAFARGAGIGGSGVPAFLRGLTPVVLRADARVTGHGYRDGAAAPYQSVLQAGTAVMVDERGLPRVRCACGNPLRPPVPVRGAVVNRGKRWPGYAPGRVVVINRADAAVDGLVVVDLVEVAWMQRRTGTDGDEDALPDILPPYGPEADITDPDAVRPPGEASPSATPEPSAPAKPDRTPRESGVPTRTTLRPGDTLPPEPPSEEPPGEQPLEPEPEPVPTGDDGMLPVEPDKEQVSDVLTGPDAPQE